MRKGDTGDSLPLGTGKGAEKNLKLEPPRPMIGAGALRVGAGEGRGGRVELWDMIRFLCLEELFIWKDTCSQGEETYFLSEIK